MAIASYLRANPEASDTADGIRRFWLIEMGQEPDRELVDAVLDDLTSSGQLVTRRLPDGGVLFRGARETNKG